MAKVNFIWGVSVSVSYVLQQQALWCLFHSCELVSSFTIVSHFYKTNGAYILIWMGYLALVAPLCLAVSLAKGTLEDNLC